MSSAPSTARSWLPARQTSQRSRTRAGAGVGLGAVADHVAEAPDLLDAAVVDRREHGLEGGQVGVDVAENGYAQAASVPWAGRGPYDGRGEPPPIRSPSCAPPSTRPPAPCATASATEPEPSLDRPPKPELGDYSSNAAMLLAAPLGDNPRAVAERLRARAGARPRRRRQPRADRGRRARLRQPLPLRRLVPARAGGAGRRRRGPRPGADRDARSGSWSSSSPPTRPGRCTSAAAATPPTATRWCGCWRRSATRSSASSTSTTPAARSTASPTRSPPG